MRADFVAKAGEDDDAEQGELSLGVPRQNDAKLVAGIRRGEMDALREFCTRFHPVLRDQARILRVPADERDFVVLGFLDDLAMKIVEGANPKALPGFVVRSFRNHLIDRYRQQKAADAAIEAHAETIGGERVVRMGCSDYTVLLTRGVGELFDDDGTRTLLKNLVDTLVEQCKPEERELMVWMSNRVPLRDVAAWLNITYSAVKVRVFRLREKLARAAEAYANGLDEPQRSDVHDILRRATVRRKHAARESVQ